MPAGEKQPASRWLRWLKREADGVPVQTRIERDLTAGPAVGDNAEGVQVECPVCTAHVALNGFICSACGFPFVCDISQLPSRAAARISGTLRQYVGVIAAVMWLLASTLLTQSNEVFNGYTTTVVSELTPVLDSGITITGPAAVESRTQLALGLLKLRAPDYYFRMRASVKEIGYLSKSYLEGPEGRKITLEGIGAIATPEHRLIRALYITIFPSGVEHLYDRDVFMYTGVLVHEMRHIELHELKLAPGGWQEEVLCEQAAYDALKQMAAPDGVLLRYELYLRNPQAREYQRWYKWYEQWE